MKSVADLTVKEFVISTSQKQWVRKDGEVVKVRRYDGFVFGNVPSVAGFAAEGWWHGLLTPAVFNFQARDISKRVLEARG